MYVHVYCVRVRLCTYYNVLYIHTPTPTCTYFDIQIAASSHHLQHVEPESHPFAPSTKQRHIHRVASRAEPLVQDGINPELDPGSMWRLWKSVQNTLHMYRRRLHFPATGAIRFAVTFPYIAMINVHSWYSCHISARSLAVLPHDLQHHWGSAGVNLGLDAKVQTLRCSHRFQCEKQRTTLSPHPPSWFVLNLICSWHFNTMGISGTLLISHQLPLFWKCLANLMIHCVASWWNSLKIHLLFITRPSARTAFTDEWVGWRRLRGTPCSPCSPTQSSVAW